MPSLAIHRLNQRPDLIDRVYEVDSAWPESMGNDPVANALYWQVAGAFPHLCTVAVDEAGEVVATARAAALQRLEQLERDFAGIVDAVGPAGADDEHDPEGATIAFERQHVAALASQARSHLAQVEAAIWRLDQGGYGICEDCAQPIPAARLAARPAITTCLPCATRR